MKKSIKYIEACFDILYLLCDLILGCYYILFSEEPMLKVLGIMAILLGGGDAFHLIPRIRMRFNKNPKMLRKSLGRGKMITSCSMTIFYLILWYFGLEVLDVSNGLFSYLMIGLAILRIVFCLMPQNRWTDENPSVMWGIIRNIPFLIMGIMVMVLFYNYGTSVEAFSNMWIAVFLSFIFYVPVVLFVHKKPMLGMLMLPKSCAYIWIIAMGLAL